MKPDGLSVEILSKAIKHKSRHLFDKDIMISNLLTDSRSLNSPCDSLFFAISTDTGDGHIYIENLIERGVINFVISKNFEYYATKYPKCNWIYVINSVEALQEVAAYCRMRTDFSSVIGITGSNGKTMTKDIIVSLLGELNVFHSPHSFNSQIGVPLSVFSACQDRLYTKETSMAVFEAGISRVGEMCRLEKIIKPDIGIFTSIGNAHQDGFRDTEEKIREKLKLFVNSKFVIVGNNASIVADIIRSTDTMRDKLIYWSFDGKSDSNYHVIREMTDNNNTRIILKTHTDSHEFMLPFTDDSYVIDTINAVVAIKTANDNIKIESLRYDMLRYINMRMEVKSAINFNTIIYDNYSFDINSLKISLDFQHRRSVNSRRKSVLILSDMESVWHAEDLSVNINKLISGYDISTLILIGTELKNYLCHFSTNDIHCFESSEMLLKSKVLDNLYNSCILIKGARHFAFDTIVSYLSPKQHPTALEVNLKSIRDNVTYYRGCLPKNHKIIGMIKADGYGLGAFEVALTLQEIGVDYLAVALADEAIDLRERGISCPIIVMNPEEHSFNNLFDYELEPEVYSFDILHKISEFAKQREYDGLESHINVHIKIDTGMHRLGFMPDEIDGLSDFINCNKMLHVKSIFSHLSSADDDNEQDFVNEQFEKFDLLSDRLISKIGYRPDRHILNTAAIERFGKTKYAYDIARLGIGIYGINPNGKDNLKPVARLRTSILQIKSLKKGSNIGYSHKNFTKKDSVIAIIPIGYADGFRRCLGNGLYYVEVCGKKVPTIGNICMDTTMIDISDCPEIKEGSTVFIFGSKQTPISGMAKSFNTIDYEVLTSVGHRVRRVYIYDDSF